MTPDLFAIAVFCITATVLALVLRQYRPEFAIFVSLACSVAVVLYVAQGIGQACTPISAATLFVSGATNIAPTTVSKRNAIPSIAGGIVALIAIMIFAV